MSGKLEAAIRRLDEEICRDSRINSELFSEMLKREREFGLVHDDRPFCPFLRPYFISRSEYGRITSAAEIIAEAFERLVEAALADRTIFSELGLSEREERMARIEPRYRQLAVSSRLDAFRCGDDFKFLEYNAENPAGISDQRQLEKVLEMVPPVKNFLAGNRHWRPAPERRLLESLLAAYRETGGKKEKPGIAIVDWRGVPTEAEFFVLRDFFESEGFPTRVADPRELEFDGEHLRVGDFPVDIFYKRVVIHEFLEKFDETHPLSQAYAAGKVCMANSFRTKIAHKKAGFAVLSDERYENLFTPEQIQIIRRHVPWTRCLRQCRTTFGAREIDLPEFLRRERENFLLKPNDDYGGKGITLGWETSQADWETALDAALENSYVAQERAPVGKETISVFSDRARTENLLVDFDPFLFFGKVEGGLVRFSSQSLVNISQGGGETAMIVLEDF